MDGGSALLQNLIFFALLLAGLYFLAIRPQRARARSLSEVRAGLAVGAQVLTTAGIHAGVSEIDGDTVLLEIAPGVRVRFVSQAVVRIVEPAAPVDEGEASPPGPAAQ
jgi:preprotein translocase subunit YajC